MTTKVSIGGSAINHWKNKSSKAARAGTINCQSFSTLLTSSYHQCFLKASSRVFISHIAVFANVTKIDTNNVSFANTNLKGERR